MEKEIVKKYINDGYSLEKLGKEYSIGKLKLKEILKKNGA